MYAHGSELQYFGKSVHDTGCESLNTLISKQSIKVALYDDHIVTKDADMTPDERFNAQNDFCVNMFYKSVINNGDNTIEGFDVLVQEHY